MFDVHTAILQRRRVKSTGCYCDTSAEMESVPATPADSASSAAETDNTEDKELQEEMAQWKQRMTALKDKENFEDKVKDARPMDWSVNANFLTTE